MTVQREKTSPTCRSRQQLELPAIQDQARSSSAAGSVAVWVIVGSLAAANRELNVDAAITLRCAASCSCCARYIVSKIALDTRGRVECSPTTWTPDRA